MCTSELPNAQRFVSTPFQLPSARLWAVAALLFGATVPTQFVATVLGGEFDAAYHPTQILVRFRPSVTAAAKEQALTAVPGSQLFWESSTLPGLAVVEVPEGQVPAAVLALRQDANVIRATPGYEMLPAEIPNDSEFSRLWGLHNIGQVVPYSGGNPSGTFDADIDAPLAWDVYTGSANCLIAVVDTGVDWRHPDLEGSVWTNPVEDINHNGVVDGTNRCGEVPPVPDGDFNCVDDDVNGYVDDIRGWDAGGNPPDNDPGIPVGVNNTHGTQVAGVVAAVGGNNQGVVGMARGCKFMPIKIADDSGAITIPRAVMGLQYLSDNAVRYNVSVSVHSYGTARYSNNCLEVFPQDLYDEFAGLQQTGAHIAVAAAGNNGSNCFGGPDNDILPVFPSNFGVTRDYSPGGVPPLHVDGLSSILSVAGTNKYDKLTSLSYGPPPHGEDDGLATRYGANTVHLGAPGALIYSTTFLGNPRSYTYDYGTGSSFAAPLVAGATALLWDRYPSWTMTQVRDRILSTVRPGAVPGVLEGRTITGGILDARRALLFDCNGNGLDDVEDITSERSPDCSAIETTCCLAKFAPGCDVGSIESCVCAPERLPDCCISEELDGTGWSQDCVNAAWNFCALRCTLSLGNMIPDECETLGYRSAIPESVTHDYNRVLGLVGPNTGPVALRIGLVQLQEPVPSNGPCCPPQNFAPYEVGTCSAAGESGEFGSCARWIGPPTNIYEKQDNHAKGFFRMSRLQCTPFYHDWSEEGIVYVGGPEIMPSSAYEILAYNPSCAGRENGCIEVGGCGTPFKTARWGDVISPFAPAGVQPDSNDVVAVVDKFSESPGALSKRFTQVFPNLFDSLSDVGGLDIVMVIDAFRGSAYPLSGPCPCPSDKVCRAKACTGPTPCGGGMCVRTCVGGINDDQLCLNDVHCPGGTCGERICIDGSNEGSSCLTEADCAGGGRCEVGGFCRDRCGRCTP